jgi:hypothetical protein
MNEEAGNRIVDLSGNNITGTLSATALWIPGKFGRAIDCSVTNQSISFPTPNFVSQGTISFWFLAKGSLHDTARLWGTGSYTNFEFFKKTSSSTWYFSVNGSNVNMNPPSTWWDGMWHHLVFQWNSAVPFRRFYTDGVLGSSSSTAFSMPALNATFYLGRADNANTAGGVFDNFNVWNCILSVNEINQLYRDPYCMYEEEV